jgi:hypothetical protein
MLNRLQPVYQREAGDTANVLLSLIDRMKTETSPLPMRYSRCEANAYHVLGRIAYDEGTEESARRAVLLFESQLELNASIGYDEGVANAKTSIAIAKSRYEGGNNEEVLKANKEFYELRVTKNGEGNEYSILAGKKYAVCLQTANHGDEAKELLMKLLVTSKQVLGPNHNTTKEVQCALECDNAPVRDRQVLGNY